MKKKASKNSTFRIDTALLEKARAIAEREDRTVRSVIERAIEQSLTTTKK